MLKTLRIRNIILIDTADIPFEQGFNVLTGETGSGKSAIIHALSLVTGERAETSMIRHGSDKGIVEAVLDVSHLPQVSQLLEEAGIEHDSNEELVIRREITMTGKSRAFLNSHQVPLSLLKKLSISLLEMVGQHANQKLFSIDNHRDIVDIFGSLQKEVSLFNHSWTEENRLRKRLEELVQNEAQRLREIDICQLELEELLTANIKENEDEALFAEYTLLTSSEELLAHTQEINQSLSGERQAALPTLTKLKQAFDKLAAMDSSLEDTAKAFNNALLELQEVSHTIHHYSSRIEHNPERVATINDRLSTIDRLKKRYGGSLDAIQAYKTKTEKKLKVLENCDLEIEELRKQLLQQEQSNQRLSEKLTHQRTEAGKRLEQAVGEELKQLNMPKAQFFCQMTPQTRNRHGNDRIEFYIAPNIGEQRVPVRDCASGGEVSRLLLALQTLLAGKELIPTLVFDEIDANIGGETASVVGEKLNAIGKKHQLLCITHFPQVASQANHHIQICKQEIEGRTVTTIKTLDNAKQQKQELARMAGGKAAIK